MVYYSAAPKIIIIGSGVLGLSVGISILKSSPNSNVTIYEKESKIGTHASTRNSGVLHAGFYYSPNSLKAKFCREGNLEMRHLIKGNGLSLLECGKIIPAKNELELNSLHDLHQRAIANGIRLEQIGSKEIKKFEPLATAYKSFLWSPDTAVSDPFEVCDLLANTFANLGGQIRLGSEIKFDEHHIPEINGKKIKDAFLVNCAGARALEIAKNYNLNSGLKLLPILGSYKFVKNGVLPLKRLVYPVPPSSNPFLGVHFTITPDGKTKIGPTAIPVFTPESYSISDSMNFSDISESFAALILLFRKSFYDTSSFVLKTLPRLWTPLLLNELKLLVPSVTKISSWERGNVGIRGQLIESDSGKFASDFIVRKSSNSIHVLNAVSPGWTSALPFGRWIAAQILEMTT